jgi:hypothetical protein
MPPQGGSRMMLGMPIFDIMMISVDPKYLRTCQRSNNPCPDDVLLMREMEGFPKKDFLFDDASSKERHVRDKGSGFMKRETEKMVNTID